MALCLVPLIINLSALAWLPEDQQVMESIVEHKRCEARYPELPCLIKFTKLGKRDYHVTCGRPKLKVE